MKKQLIPINNNLLVTRHTPLKEGLIHRPDDIHQKAFYATIDAVGNGVKDTFLQPNLIIFVCPTARDNQRFEDKWIIKEHDITAIRFGKTMRAFGNRVLIKRLNQETKIGSIIIPDCHDSADQSLEGIIVSLGVKNGTIIDFPSIGEKARIEKWSPDIIEIDVDGEYYLSVKTKEICYVEHA